MEISATPSLYGERGAGGKFRPPSARKPPSTPYDRPPSAANKRSWLSKLVDPAYRVLHGGATKILPSFFSKSPAALPLPIDNNDPDDEDSDLEPSKKDNDDGGLNHGEGTSSEDPDKSEIGKGKDNNVSRIEQLIQGKTFSRDEINRLKKILNGRIIDEDEEQKKDYKEEETNKKAIILGETVTDLAGDENEIGASPIDIARAYMGNKNLSKPQIVIESKSIIPSPSPTPTHWPGSIVSTDQHNYQTPITQKPRFGLHNFPRTPYSSTIYSNSRSKLNSSQTHTQNFFHQSHTPIFSQVKKREDELGSTGPIRRTRNKFASEAKPRGESIFMEKKKNIKGGETSNSSKLEYNISTSQAVKRIINHLDNTKPPTPKEKAAELKLATSWRNPVSSSTPNQVNNNGQKEKTKPNLSTISITKNSDNGLGFTFPVSESLSVFSEPPTPSFIPTTTQASSTVPCYSFGAKKSSSTSLVFSFPSTNTTNTSQPNFTFGSSDKPRLSFNSIGKVSI